MLPPNNILQNFESVLNDENDKKNQSYYYEDEFKNNTIIIELNIKLSESNTNTILLNS